LVRCEGRGCSFLVVKWVVLEKQRAEGREPERRWTAGSRGDDRGMAEIRIEIRGEGRPSSAPPEVEAFLEARDI
jgi:hypothetical protein